MKTIALRNCTAVCLSVLLVATMTRAVADQTATTLANGKNRTGTVTVVDTSARRLTIKHGLFTKHFNLGDTCNYSFVNNAIGTSAGLRPGQKVTVYYQDADGVLVASRVEQIPLFYEGTVKAMDSTNHTVTVQARTFAIGDDCRVVLKDDKSGTLADILPGHHVTVTYEVPGGKNTARLIAQTSATFTGSLTAIDLGERTIKAKATFNEETFNLANGCTILLNGKQAELRDLKPGDKLTFSYDVVNGINVATRIAYAE